jgi:hypothetical protein
VGEFIGTVFIMACFGIFAWIILASSEKQKKHANAREKNVQVLFAQEKDASIARYKGVVGLYGGPVAYVYLGTKGIIFDAYNQSEPVWIPYEEVYSVNARRPAIPQMLNVNTSALLANAMTRAQVGNTVTFNVDADYRTVDIVIGQLGPSLAADLEDKALRLIYEKTGKRAD